MCTFTKAKVVRLSTTNDSNIYLKPQNGHLVIVTNTRVKRYVTALNFPKHHLYIISDDEIKEGDYYIIDDIPELLKNNGLKFIDDYCKKVIATTDTSLYTHQKETVSLPERVFYLPQPSQQFIQKYIEEYNKGNIITDVLVEYKFNDFKFMATLCTTKEKEYTLKINPKDNTITIKKLKETYNKEELCQVLEKYTSFIWSEVGIHYPISLGNDAKDKFINSEL